MTEFSLSEPLLTLLPLNLDARNAMSLRHNTECMRYGLRRASLDAIAGAACDLAIQFDLDMLLGRRALSCGTSRSALFTFPDDKDIESHHFTIAFDQAGCGLQLTNLSATGLWYRRQRDETWLHLQESTIKLESGLLVGLGSGRRYRFLAVVNQKVCLSNDSFRAAFQQYVSSVQAASSSIMLARNTKRPMSNIGVQAIDVRAAKRLRYQGGDYKPHGKRTTGSQAGDLIAENAQAALLTEQPETSATRAETNRFQLPNGLVEAERSQQRASGVEATILSLRERVQFAEWLLDGCVQFEGMVSVLQGRLEEAEATIIVQQKRLVEAQSTILAQRDQVVDAVSKYRRKGCAVTGGGGLREVFL